jgi:hypothetical protein
MSIESLPYPTREISNNLPLFLSDIGAVSAEDLNGYVTLNGSEFANKADKSNVLELDNTTPFTPTADNHPATKAYVDENAGSVLARWFRMARMVSVKTTGNITIYGRSTTGYMAVRSWDGTVTIFGTGVATTQYSINLAVPSSGAWSNSAPKEIFIWSCTAGNANQSGDLTYLKLNNNKLTSFDGTGLTSLIDLRLNSNSLTSFDGTGLTSVTNLYLDNNSLTSFNGTGLTSLIYLYLDNNSLASFDGTGLTSLTNLFLNDNNLTSFNGAGLTSLTYLDLNNNSLTSFNGAGLTSLTELYLDINSLTSFDGAALTSLTDLSLSYNNLTSFDGAGLTSLTSLNLDFNSLTALSMASSPDVESIKLEYNSLDATALDAFYTSLGASPGVLSYWYFPGIYVFGNTGTSGDDPSIATAKDHTVYGS